MWIIFRNLSNDNGFTLIETLIAFSILAASVVVFSTVAFSTGTPEQHFERFMKRPFLAMLKNDKSIPVTVKPQNNGIIVEYKKHSKTFNIPVQQSGTFRYTADGVNGPKLPVQGGGTVVPDSSGVVVQ